jgi:hypothetical protein
MGDFNINLLRFATLLKIFFFVWRALIWSPTIDKPTCVYGNSATLIDNIFVNKTQYDIRSGNIISDIKWSFFPILFFFYI